MSEKYCSLFHQQLCHFLTPLSKALNLPAAPKAGEFVWTSLWMYSIQYQCGSLHYLILSCSLYTLGCSCLNAANKTAPMRQLETYCSFPPQTSWTAHTVDSPWCQFQWLPWRLDLKSVTLRGQNKMEPTHCCTIIYRWPCDRAQLQQRQHHTKRGHWICICSCILTDVVVNELRQGDVHSSHHRCCCVTLWDTIRTLWWSIGALEVMTYRPNCSNNLKCCSFVDVTSSLLWII